MATLPLVVGDRRGAFSVLLGESRRFFPEERRFLELLARSCEQGLLRASFFEAEQAARTRADVLQALAATLSGAVAVAGVGGAFLDSALRHLPAASGALLLADDEGRTLTAVATAGSAESRACWPSSIPIDEGYVAGKAFRSASPVRIAARDELVATFPAMAASFGASTSATVVVPRSERLRFVVLLLRMCCLNALPRRNFPLFVRLKRLAAPR